MKICQKCFEFLIVITNIVVTADGLKYAINAFNAVFDIVKNMIQKSPLLFRKRNISACYVNKEMHTKIIEDVRKFETSFIHFVDKNNQFL